MLDVDEKRFVLPQLVGLRSGYVLAGGTGEATLPVAEANGGVVLFSDGASEYSPPPIAKDRIFVVRGPGEVYRDYMEVVSSQTDRYYPKAAEILQFAQAADTSGGAMVPLYARVAFRDKTTWAQLIQGADRLVTKLKGVRQGRLKGATCHYVGSCCGGWGAPLLLDARELVNRAFWNYQGRNVHNVMWLLGEGAFLDFEGAHKRHLNHIMRMLEVAADLQVVESKERHVFDHVLMFDLASGPDELRFARVQAVLRLSNPLVWDKFMDRWINFAENADLELDWLKQYAHLSAGTLQNAAVSIYQILALVRSRLERKVAHDIGSESIVYAITPEYTCTKGTIPSAPAIQDLVAQGNLNAILSQMVDQNAHARADIAFSLGGDPIPLESLLSLSSTPTASRVAVRLETLRLLERGLSEEHRAAVAKRGEAQRKLDEANAEGPMGKLISLVSSFIPGQVKNVIRWGVGQFFRAVTDQVTRRMKTAPGQVAEYVRDINSAKQALAEAEAIIALLESPSDPDSSIIRQIGRAIRRMKSRAADSLATLTTIPSSTAVDPAAQVLASAELETLVDGLLRKRRSEQEIRLEALRYFQTHALSLEQLAAILHAQPNMSDVASAIAHAFHMAEMEARYQTAPVFHPWMRLVILPLVDQQLLRDLTKALAEIMPGVELWSEPHGDGGTVSLGYAIAHGVKTVAEVVPPEWRDSFEELRSDPRDLARRAFKDRVLPSGWDLAGGD